MRSLSPTKNGQATITAALTNLSSSMAKKREEQVKKTNNKVIKTWDAIRSINSFDWDEYSKSCDLRTNENPKKLIDPHSYWFYVSFTYFNWVAS